MNLSTHFSVRMTSAAITTSILQGEVSILHAILIASVGSGLLCAHHCSVRVSRVRTSDVHVQLLRVGSTNEVRSAAAQQRHPQLQQPLFQRQGQIRSPLQSATPAHQSHKVTF